jgi:triosephosphate isomerase
VGVNEKGVNLKYFHNVIVYVGGSVKQRASQRALNRKKNVIQGVLLARGDKTQKKA